MKSLQFSASLALALALGIVLPAASATPVFAVSQYASTTKAELDAAINKAEAALKLDLSSTAEHNASKVYLEKLISQAKSFSADFQANIDKNLGDLKDALNEGAEILAIWAKQDANKAQKTVAMTNNANVEAVAYVMPQAAVEVRTVNQTEPVQVAGVISEENRRKLEGQTGNTTSTNKNNQNKAEELDNNEDNSDSIDVPQTGEVTEGAKPSGVGMGLIVAGVALLAGAGAVLFARQAKRK